MIHLLSETQRQQLQAYVTELDGNDAHYVQAILHGVDAPRHRFAPSAACVARVNTILGKKAKSGG